MATTESVSPLSNEKAQHVVDALQYLEAKGVKALLHNLTQSMLVERPDNLGGYMIEKLRAKFPGEGEPAKETTGRSSSSAISTAACSFLATTSSGPSAAIQGLLDKASQSFQGSILFFSCPGGRGRRAKVHGTSASQFAGQQFLLVASSSSQAEVGQPATSPQEACLQAAVASPGAGSTSGNLAACTVLCSEGLEGILMAESSNADETGLNDMLSSLQLWAAVLAERLERMHWQEEANRASSVIGHMLRGLESMASVNPENSHEAETSIENVVPGDVLRCGVLLPDVEVIQIDKRSGALLHRDVFGKQIPQLSCREGLAMHALAHAARSGNTEILCSDQLLLSDASVQQGCEICVAFPEPSQTARANADRPASPLEWPESTQVAVRFASSGSDQLSHSDLVAAEYLAKSSIPAALQARLALQHLLTNELKERCMQSFVAKLSTAHSTSEFVSAVEQTVLKVTNSEYCSVYFFDEDNEEVWAPETRSVPELTCTPLGQGLPGKVTEMAVHDPQEKSKVLLSNNLPRCPHWTEEDESDLFDTLNLMIVPIMTAGQMKQPLGLIRASNKKAPSQAGPAHYTEADSEWLDLLAKAAASHLERLQLDVMFTKTMLEHDLQHGDGEESESGSILKIEDEALMSEYYSKDIVNKNSRQGRRRSQLCPVEVKTVHNFMDAVDTCFAWENHDDTDHQAISLRRSMSEGGNIASLCPDEHADPNNWRVDYWAMSEADQFVLFATALRMFDLPDELSLPPKRLQKFFGIIRSNYRAVPFHNFHHAISTVHYSSKLTKMSHLEEVLAPADLFAIVVASLCHDTDHRGYNNAFEMMTRSELSLRYNDYSPLENHHCARAFELALSSPDVNIFQVLKQDVYNVVRKRIVAGILATDMKHHGHHVGLLRDFELGEASDSQSQFLVEVMIHAADISNPYMPPDISSRWSVCLNEEFTKQVADEEYMGLPITAFMKGLNEPQVAAKALLGFIDFVITPLTSSIFRLFPDLSEAKQFLEQNRADAAAVLDGDKLEDSNAERKLQKKSTRLPKRGHLAKRQTLKAYVGKNGTRGSIVELV